MRAARNRLTYANVVATIALFVAVGGASAFAASQLAKNSVGTKQIKNNAVTAAKIKNGVITAAKVANGSLTGAQITASTLGTVPAAQSAQTAKTAQTAQTAETATSLASPEAWHEVGTPGQPEFMGSWDNVKLSFTAFPETVAFYKDQGGLVHLRGEAISGTGGTAIFDLPAGDRPANRRVLNVPVACGGAGCPNGVSSSTIIGPNLAGGEDGAVVAPTGATAVSLDGVTFRAAS